MSGAIKYVPILKRFCRMRPKRNNHDMIGPSFWEDVAVVAVVATAVNSFSARVSIEQAKPVLKHANVHLIHT